MSHGRNVEVDDNFIVKADVSVAARGRNNILGEYTSATPGFTTLKNRVLTFSKN